MNPFNNIIRMRVVLYTNWFDGWLTMISDQAQEAYEVNCAIPRQHGYVRVTGEIVARSHLLWLYLISQTSKSDDNKDWWIRWVWKSIHESIFLLLTSVWMNSSPLSLEFCSMDVAVFRKILVLKSYFTCYLNLQNTDR